MGSLSDPLAAPLLLTNRNSQIHVELDIPDAPGQLMMWLRGLRSEVRMPTRQPSLGREPVRKQVWKEHGYAVQNLRLQPCLSNHTNVWFVQTVRICLPNALLDVQQVLVQTVAIAAFAEPIVHGRDSWCSKQISNVDKRNFPPMFLCACLNHFSHALIPDVQNFVPRIPPTNRAWSSNHASDHTSKVDIEFDHIGTMNAPGPSSKTSDWCHDGIEEFQFVSDGNISAQKNRLVGKEGAICRLQTSTSTSTSTLYAPLGSLFEAQGGNCETTSYIHQHLQNSKNSGRFERQSSTSIAETSHEGKFFQRQKFVIKVSQEYPGLHVWNRLQTTCNLTICDPIPLPLPW